MAKTLDDFAPIGTLVYQAFKPNKPGKVIDIKMSKRHPRMAPFTDRITVKFEDGTQGEFERSNLNDYEELINEHKRKYLKFEAIAQRLKLI